jgi:hypothetical protein
LPGSHAEPLQQPAHVVLSQTHTPLEQRCPVAHAGPPPQVHVPPDEHPSPAEPHDWHVEPPVPHDGPVGGDVHTLPLQHPLGHDAELQTHAPPLQIWPAAHGGPAPHAHAPEGEQLSACVGLQPTQELPSVPQLERDGVVHEVPLQHPVLHEVALQTHCPVTHTCPGPQAAEVPQLHCPLAEQLSAVAGSHAAQAAPAVPQLVNPGV